MAERKVWVKRGLTAVGLVTMLAAPLLPSWKSFHEPLRLVTVEEDVPYAADDARQRMDVYAPRVVPPSPPVVVFVHGGFWKPQNRRMFLNVTGLYGGVGASLAARGIPTAVIGYRQMPEAGSVQNALNDVTAAIRAVWRRAALMGGDVRLYVVGHSAGAFLTAQLALDPSHLANAGVPPGAVRGFACLSGVYDLERILPALDADLASAVRSSAGDAAGLARFSPARRDPTGHPPLLLMVGTQDEKVMQDEARAFRDVLMPAKGPLTWVDVPDASHMSVVMHLHKDADPVRLALEAFMEQNR